MLRRNNNYVPDVLDCLANLSNDEVLTPPNVANKMLDLLPQEVFDSKETTFLDPFTKSGVFLREITKRLLSYQVPDYLELSNEIELLTKEAIQNAVRNGKLDLNDEDYEEKARAVGDAAIKNSPKALRYFAFERELQDALDHILTKQVFGIAITELTANLSRRSLYCSKNAAGKYSVSADAFGSVEEGNIRFVPMKHTWKNGSCIFCGASAATLNRPDDYESHAYEFIHREELEEIFMGFQFTVVCGNPPYQLADGSGGSTDAAMPIYQKFIQQAKRLDSKYLLMIVPSKWMVGGRGLDKFREEMINDNHICEMYDFEDPGVCFPGIHLDGGVCYFLRDKTYEGDIHYIFQNNLGEIVESNRTLSNPYFKFVIRDNRIISIIQKVLSGEQFSSIVSSTKPYGVRKDLFNNPNRYPEAKMSDSHFEGSYHIYGVKGLKGGAKRKDAYVSKTISNNNEDANKYKLFFTTSYSTNALIPPEPIMGLPGDICTETFLSIGPFETEEEMKNCYDYIHTSFFRFLLYFGKGSMQVTKTVFSLIPLLPFTKSWTDEDLYKHFSLSTEEIAFIETMIKNKE